jgi:hypothetical protein
MESLGLQLQNPLYAAIFAGVATAGYIHVKNKLNNEKPLITSDYMKPSFLVALLAITYYYLGIEKIFSEKISVPQGKVIEIVSLIGAVYVAPILNGIRGSGSVFDSRYIPAYICGPAELYLESYWSVMPITYRLKDNVSSTTTIPTSAVVIPTDATGPVNIILESSTDLVTWTAANPGTYGASTTKRFFRVRAVNQ